MNPSRYLNVVLTVLALMLGMNLYVQLADGTAEMLSPAHAAEARGIGSQAERQQAMVQELKAMNSKLDRIDSTLNTKTFKVETQGMTPSE